MYAISTRLNSIWFECVIRLAIWMGTIVYVSIGFFPLCCAHICTVPNAFTLFCAVHVSIRMTNRVFSDLTRLHATVWMNANHFKVATFIGSYRWIDRIWHFFYQSDWTVSMCLLFSNASLCVLIIFVHSFSWGSLNQRENSINFALLNGVFVLLWANWSSQPNVSLSISLSLSLSQFYRKPFIADSR